MSVDIEDFEDMEPGESGTNAERILAFLAANSEEAWRPSAIAEETGVDRDSVGPTLDRLKDRQLVRHRSPYWAVTEESDAVRSFLEDE